MPDPPAGASIGSAVHLPSDAESPMPSPIIAALDPEHEDDAPLVVAAALSDLTGAPLIALSAYLHDPITNAVGGGLVDEDLRADALSALGQRAGDSGARLMVHGGPSPARVLHDAAVELDACLVVVGSTRRGRLGRVMPGTTAERLLHGSPCAVAVAPAELAADWTPRRVGVGFVDVEDAHGAVRAAAAIARAAHADLRAATVVEPVTRSQSAVIEPYRADGLIDSATANARRALDHVLALLPSAVAATSEVVVGSPADGLSALSRDVDLLVCGSRAYGPARHVLLGSVTHAVIRDASCPVVLVPRGTHNGLVRGLDPAQQVASR